jgi:hypothetical protein
MLSRIEMHSYGNACINRVGMGVSSIPHAPRGSPVPWLEDREWTEHQNRAKMAVLSVVWLHR